MGGFWTNSCMGMMVDHFRHSWGHCCARICCWKWCWLCVALEYLGWWLAMCGVVVVVCVLYVLWWSSCPLLVCCCSCCWRRAALTLYMKQMCVCSCVSHLVYWLNLLASLCPSRTICSPCCCTPSSAAASALSLPCLCAMGTLPLSTISWVACPLTLVMVIDVAPFACVCFQ